MNTRQLSAILLFAVLSSYAFTVTDADIINWQTGETIPGTEGIVPRPGMNLSRWNTDEHNLRYADLQRMYLPGAFFRFSYLDDARLNQANLTGAHFFASTLTRADLTDAVIAEATFDRTTTSGFTKEQLYSTASYKSKDLHGISLSDNDLSGWDFTGRDLRGAQFFKSDHCVIHRLAYACVGNVQIRGSEARERQVFVHGCLNRAGRVNDETPRHLQTGENVHAKNNLLKRSRRHRTDQHCVEVSQVLIT